MNLINVALIDDENLFRKGLKLLLNDLEGISFVAEYSNGQEFIDALRTTKIKIDIIFLDLQMPILNGIETARILAKEFPEIRVIILSSHFSRGFVFNLLEIGAASYLVKNSNIDKVEKTIRQVHENGFYYDEKLQTIIHERWINKNIVSDLTFEIKVTKREKEILQLICEQYTNAEIAKKLFLSIRTVDGHRSNLLRKFNRKNTAGLVAFAIQKKIVTIDSSLFWS